MQDLIIDKSKTAVLIMDYQKEIIATLAEERQKPLAQTVKMVLETARRVRLPVIYIVARCRDGYPEVNPRNKVFSSIKESGRLREGTAEAEVIAELAPQPSEPLVTKRRVGAFYATDLEIILRSKGISTIVLMGIVTTGVVMTTVREAADMDYEVVLISDGCADRDPEVHSMLMEKVFPRHATVVTAQEFLSVCSQLKQDSLAS